MVRSGREENKSSAVVSVHRVQLSSQEEVVRVWHTEEGTGTSKSKGIHATLDSTPSLAPAAGRAVQDPGSQLP